VELGCGSGFVICSIALMLQKLGLHASVQAVDHSQAALEATQQTLTNHKVRYI
jgi:methylase of polypeptide subunit release factors